MSTGGIFTSIVNFERQDYFLLRTNILYNMLNNSLNINPNNSLNINPNNSLNINPNNKLDKIIKKPNKK